MAISQGARLGPYEVLAPVGAGGMGEVYKARDTRLERTVAIKVLPQHLSASPEGRQRFEREAKTISQLSHPHICALYDVGNQDGVEYLVMEYLEGETLAERLVKGPLPLEQTLRWGMEIADALEKAHRQGIVHRDLKPGNVMLTRSGVKLLDFGLAKAVQPTPAVSSLTSFPTETPALTAEGTILGTFQYMAPEQLEGKEADARTDIFAFGAVLYEMATGRKAFSGKSQASLIAAILEREPEPISASQPMAPPALDRVVKACLAKDPEDRLQTAHDVGLQLKWIAEGGSSAGLPTSVAARRKGRERLAGGLIGLLVGAALAGLAVRALTSRSSPPRQPTRFALATGSDTPVFTAPWNPLAISPDGRLLAAVLTVGSSVQIFLHRLDQSGWTPIAGTEGATSPVFSPDGRWIAFQSLGKIKRVPVSGGAPIPVCDALGSYGLAWGDDAVWFGSTTGLMKASLSGGKPQLVVPLATGQTGVRRPQVLPGGRAVVFVGFSPTRSASRIETFSLDTGRRRTLVEGGFQPTYSPTGHLLYVTEQLGGIPVALPFDPKRLEVTGSPTPALEDAVGAFVVSGNGTMAYLPSYGTRISTLAWVDRTGKAEPLPALPHFFEQPRLSPDGKSIVLAGREGEMEIWVYGVERGSLVRLTLDPDEDETPVWTPDGQRVIYRRVNKILSKATDGSGAEELLATSGLNWHVSDVSPDGHSLAIYALGDTGEDIFTLPLDGKSNLTPFLKTQANEKCPAFSPDGRWIAYVSDETGRDEIYVLSYPGPGGKFQVSTDGGAEPVWARDGSELFYRSGNRMMAVGVRTQPSFSASAPRLLFEGRFGHAHRGHPNYAVSPDGKRFLMIRGQESDAPLIQVILDWSADLLRRASAR